MKHKIQQLLDKLNRAKAEQKLAEENLKNIQDKIREMNVDPENIDGAISELRKNRDALEKKLNKRIGEVENELKNYNS